MRQRRKRLGQRMLYGRYSIEWKFPKEIQNPKPKSKISNDES
jgi:hypothetical protein